MISLALEKPQIKKIAYDLECMTGDKDEGKIQQCMSIKENMTNKTNALPVSLLSFSILLSACMFLIVD